MMIKELIILAEQSMQCSNSIQSNLLFKQIIKEPANLHQILSGLKHSDTLLFAYCSNMIKMIENGEYDILLNQKHLLKNENLLEIAQIRMDVYSKIINSMVHIIKNKDKASYIIKSCIDLVSICLKALLVEGCSLDFLEIFIKYFLPNYKSNSQISMLSKIQHIVLFEAATFIDKHYPQVLSIFISTLQFINIQGSHISFYEFRSNLNYFKDKFLPHLLYFGTSYLKLLFQYWINSSDKNDQRIVGFLSQTLLLMEYITNYPFLSAKTDFDDEKDEINIFSDLFFPNYFKHFLCDFQLMQTLLSFLQHLTNQSGQIKTFRKQIYSLIKIINKISCPSQYIFKTVELRQSRKFSLKILEFLCTYIKCSDSYYLSIVLDVIFKFLHLLEIQDRYLIYQKQVILEYTITFLTQVIKYSCIVIEEGKRNPVAKAFQILNIILKSEEEDEKHKIVLTQYSQNILKILFERILGHQSRNWISQFGFNTKYEIERFQELFQNVKPIFESNLKENIQILAHINPFQINDCSKIVWIHLCAQLLPNSNASEQLAKIAYNYFKLTKSGQNLACLNYINNFTQEILSECYQGCSNTSLWSHFNMLSDQLFQDFIKQIIVICISNFNQNHSEIIDYSLLIFKNVYMNLKKFDQDNLNFKSLYQIVETLIKQINSTIFAKKQYYHKRRTLFSIISTIWLNNEDVTYIYEIHRLIRQSNFQSQADRGVLSRYFYDISGLFQAIESADNSIILSELVVEDLQQLFKLYMSSDQHIHHLFSDSNFLKVFVKMIRSLLINSSGLTSKIHKSLPLKFYTLFYPYLLAIIHGNYDIPKALPKVLESFVYLNDMAVLLPINIILDRMKSISLDTTESLLNTYFQHIQQIEDISWLYRQIKNNIDYMILWWDQAIFRNLKPQINLKTIAESKIWLTKRHHDSFAKLIYVIGLYDQSYWDISGFNNEGLFVKAFNQRYPFEMVK